MSDEGGVRIVAAASDHRPVEPSLGYRIEHEGRAVVIAGDTVPCAGLDELCAGADVYVQTVLRDDLVSLVPMQRFRTRSTTTRRSCRPRRPRSAAGVRTLVLTHQVPTPAAGSADEWLALAHGAFQGTIVFGEDLTRVTTDGS